MERPCKKYHKDVYMPLYLTKFVMFKEKQIDLENYTISDHLKDHIKHVDEKHKYTFADIHKALSQAKEQPIEPFEITTSIDDKYLIKFCIRVKLDSENDICISYTPGGKKVITAWINNKYDTHKTLDYSKYVQKPKNI